MCVFLSKSPHLYTFYLIKIKLIYPTSHSSLNFMMYFTPNRNLKLNRIRCIICMCVTSIKPMYVMHVYT